MSILLVDDSDTMRLLIKRDLRLAGWDDIDDVPDAGAAIEAVSAGEVDLVLADWNMPGTGGLDLLHEMQRRGLDAKVGFITCEASPQLRAEALRAGAQFVLTKPVSGGDLDWHIRSAMGMSAPPGDPPAPDRARSLADVLSALFQRDVSVTATAGPRQELARCVTHYEDPASRAGGIEAVVEMPLAVALGCSLARVPARQAQEWNGAHTLTGTVEDAFMEVANVLATFVSPPGERHVLKSVGYLGEARSAAATDGWLSSFEVMVEDHQPGRLGWRRSPGGQGERADL